MPGPFFATYASTKAFLNTFSLSVSGEMRRKNVQCACLLPGKTNCPRFWDTPRLTGTVKDTSGFASPHDVAQKGLRLLEENRDYGVQGLRNYLTQFVKRFIPLPLLCFAIEKHNYNPILED
jgi:short-subunit dehydrogenase